jgi:cell division transport system permease protein
MSTWLRLHGLALGAALRRIASQPWSSAMSILLIGFAFTLAILAAVVLRTLGAAAATLDTDPHANVFLSLDATDEEARKVGDALRAHPEAASVRFVSRTQALEELKATTHLAELLAAMDRNPLPHAFTVRLRSADPARLEAARAAWSRLPKVDQVASDFEWAGRLARWVNLADRVLFGLAVALGAAVAFIVGHLTRLQVVTRREEIQVSQLIGATAADVRRTFLYHGALQGALAGLAGLALAAALALWARQELSALTPTYAAELKGVFLSPMESAGVIAAALALGLAGAWIAVRRELSRFSSAP